MPVRPLTREVFLARKESLLLRRVVLQSKHRKWRRYHVLVPTVEIKAVFAVWLPHGVYSFSCENIRELYYLRTAELP